MDHNDPTDVHVNADGGIHLDTHSGYEATGETLWRMPLFDEHEKAMKSKVADLQNAGSRDGGASTAAGFLAAFAGDRPWAHRYYRDNLQR